MNNLSKSQSAIAQPLGDSQGVQKNLPLESPSKNQSELAFLYDNFPIVFIKKDVVPILSFEVLCNLLKKSNISFSSYFTTAKKFHCINYINSINERNKYLINDINNINNKIELIDNWSGVAWRERNC